MCFFSPVLFSPVPALPLSGDLCPRVLCRTSLQRLCDHSRALPVFASSQRSRGTAGLDGTMELDTEHLPRFSVLKRVFRFSVLKGLGLPPLLPTGILPLIFH